MSLQSRTVEFLYKHLRNAFLISHKDTKMEKVMARGPQGNYIAIVNQASQITICHR